MGPDNCQLHGAVPKAPCSSCGSIDAIGRHLVSSDSRGARLASECARTEGGVWTGWLIGGGYSPRCPKERDLSARTATLDGSLRTCHPHLAPAARRNRVRGFFGLRRPAQGGAGSETDRRMARKG